MYVMEDITDNVNDYVSFLGNKGTNPTNLPLAVGLSVTGVVMVMAVVVFIVLWRRYVDPYILDKRSPIAQDACNVS